MSISESVTWSDERIAAFMSETQPPNLVDPDSCSREEALAHWGRVERNECAIQPRRKQATLMQVLRNLAAGFFSF